MPDQNNPLQQAFFAQSLGPQGYQKYLQAQQQQALANALLQQGTTPISTEGRSIGGVGYRISPLEGVAKLAQALSGAYGQSKANEALANALFPQSQDGSTTPSNPSGQKVANADGTLTPYGSMLEMSGARGIPELAANELKQQGQQISNPLTTQTIGGVEQTLPLQDYLGMRTNQQTPQMPTQQPSIPNGTPAPITPVQTQPLPGSPPPMGGTPDPQTAQALASYRQQNGMQTPPVDLQRTASGIPVGVASNLSPGSPMTQGLASPPPRIPQVNSSALQPNAPLPPQSNIPPPALPAQMPGGAPPPFGKVVLTPQQQANLELQKEVAEETAKAPLEGVKKEAETQGELTAQNMNQYATSASQLPNVLGRLNDMHQANVTSSFNALNDNDGAGPITSWHNIQKDPASVANNKLIQLKQQGLISQIGPQLAGAGAKGNKLLEGIIQGSDSVNLAAGKNSVASQIDGLGLNYVRNMIGQYDKANADKLNPSPMPPVLMKTPKGVGYVDPRHVADAINNGATFNLGGVGTQ